MSNLRVSDTATLVRLLVEGGVEFIVVGMSAAVFLGGPATTLDLDIVHRRTSDNVERLRTCSQTSARITVTIANRKPAPTAEALAGHGRPNLQTNHGPLDLLCQLDDLGYEELLPRTILVEDGPLSLRVLDLPTLIEVKTRAARPKDMLALPLLLATLDEQFVRALTACHRMRRLIHYMEPYRDSHRTCPHCNAELRVFRDQLVCDTCGGVMLSIDDLRGAIEELTGLEPTLSYRNETPGRRPCPHCATPMTTANLAIVLEGVKPVKPDPQLDRCATHGLWFDDSELAMVLEPVAGKGFGGGRAHTRSALDRKSTVEPRSFNFKIGGRGWGL